MFLRNHHHVSSMDINRDMYPNNKWTIYIRGIIAIISDVHLSLQETTDKIQGGSENLAVYYTSPPKNYNNVFLFVGFKTLETLETEF